MKSKKAQSDRITTILLTLVALAAVAVIAVFITNQVRNGTPAIAIEKDLCISAEPNYLVLCYNGTQKYAATSNELNIEYAKTLLNCTIQAESDILELTYCNNNFTGKTAYKISTTKLR